MRFAIITLLFGLLAYSAPASVNNKKVEKVEATYEKKGNQLVIKNGGPIDYHIDIKNVYRLVDGSNQLMAVATKMIHHTPRSIFDIGFGVGSLSRYFVHENKNLIVDATDLDYKIIQDVYAPIMNEYMSHISGDEKDRIRIKPSDGKQLITEIFQKTTFDVVWLDILDDNYKNPRNLLFDSDFFRKIDTKNCFSWGCCCCFEWSVNR